MIAGYRRCYKILTAIHCYNLDIQCTVRVDMSNCFLYNQLHQEFAPHLRKTHIGIKKRRFPEKEPPAIIAQIYAFLFHQQHLLRHGEIARG